MSAVDSPPGLAFAGLAAGEFSARTRSKRLAQLSFGFVLVSSAVTLLLAFRKPFVAGVETVIVLPLFCMCVAAVGLAVRQATLRITEEGIRWGWGFAGFRMTASRMKRVLAYDDAIAVTPQRGSIWYLARRDWEGLDRAVQALRESGLEFRKQEGRAPWRARIQSYGGVLDSLLVANVVGSTYLVLAALTL